MAKAKKTATATATRTKRYVKVMVKWAHPTWATPPMVSDGWMTIHAAADGVQGWTAGRVGIDTKDDADLYIETRYIDRILEQWKTEYRPTHVDVLGKSRQFTARDCDKPWLFVIVDKKTVVDIIVRASVSDSQATAMVEADAWLTAVRFNGRGE